MAVLTAIYVATALLLAVYAFNAWVLTALFLKHRCSSSDQTSASNEGSADTCAGTQCRCCNPHSKKSAFDTSGEKLPSVTVQLPIFNEALVIERLIDAVVRLDYPKSRLEIQVLDDSTDETTEIALARVEHYRRQGYNISLNHRQDRTGFKAGALKQGMAQTAAEFIAIFDADFLPEPDFLRQTISHFLENDRLGFVQTRWGHVNRHYSWLTAAQALALDGHFAVEQTARNRSGLLMNFNGTAGVWRRRCIESAGHWQGDTISEDFDLSYRAQLAGWECLFLPEVVAPAEVPPQLAAFKRQQFRWAKGSIQCLKKLGWPVLRSPLSWWVKLQALIHLSSYLVHPLMVVLAVIIPIMVLTGATDKIRFPLIYLSLVSLGPPFLYAVAQKALHPTAWRKNYKAMGLLIFLGSGIALSNTKAVVEALLGVGNVFRRTPKFKVTAAADRWQESSYRLPLEWLALGEVALSLHSFLGAWLAAASGHQFAVPFILLYAFSFGYVGVQGLWDGRKELGRWLKARSQRSARRSEAGRHKPLSAGR